MSPGSCPNHDNPPKLYNMTKNKTENPAINIEGFTVLNPVCGDLAKCNCIFKMD